MTVDLHIHSTYSDGTCSPAELVAIARARGLTAISITDHDTMEGTAEALDAGAALGIEIVPGLEMSVVHGSTHLHLLGYYADPGNNHLAGTLRDIQQARLERNNRIIEKLNDLSLVLTLSDVEAKSTLGQTGRPHIAQVLLEKGYVATIDQAFSRYLGRGAAAYVPRKVMDAGESIRLIRSAGGIAVLAHPATIDNSLRTIPALVQELVDLGLEGVEAFYPAHSRKNQKQLTTLAQCYGLVVTGGSDHHGDIRPGTTMASGTNVYVPPFVLEQLKQRLDR